MAPATTTGDAGFDRRVRSFTARRQRLGGHPVAADSDGGASGAADPAERLLAALHAVVAVYSSQPSGPLSLAARVDGFDAAAYAALEHDQRRAVRVPAMRLSSHLVPTDTVARVTAATRPPLERVAWSLKALGLTLDDDFPTLRDQLVDAAATPLAAKPLREALGWPAEQVRSVAQIAAVEGTVLRVGGAGLRSNAVGWVATEAWLGAPLDRPDPDAALAWLAGEYLRAFGPAGVDDFAWWTSCGKQRAATAVAGLDTVEVAPGLLLRADDAEVFAAVEPLPDDHVDLVPVWDAYTMGYPSTGRARFGPPEVLDRLYDPAGNGLGVVLAGGRAVGSWNSRFRGRTMEVDMEALGRWPAAVRRSVDARLAGLAELLGAHDLVVVPVAGGTRRPVGGKGNRRSYVTG